MPTKIQFDKWALDWIEGVTDVEAAATPERIDRTYRLTFDHCLAGTCKRACAANPRCLSGLTGVSLTAALDRLFTAETPHSGARQHVPAGLRNLGATCYVNSLLQVWFHDREFRRLILRWDRYLDPGEADSSPAVPQTIIGHLQLLFARLLKSPKATVDPSAFVEFLGLDIEYQQDASELADLLFTRIVEQLRVYPDQSLAGELEDVYRGELNNVVECLSCGSARRSRDVFFRLNLNIQGVRSIQQCFRGFAQKKNMDGEFRCYDCVSTGKAASYEEIVALPPVLNLQLQRYRFDLKAGTRRKIKATVRFPPTLNMEPFVKGISGPLLYDLKAVLVHLGQTATSGHYIANVKVPVSLKGDACSPRPNSPTPPATVVTSRWYRLNDETVSEWKDRAEFDKELPAANSNGDADESNGHKDAELSGEGCPSDQSDVSGDDVALDKMNLNLKSDRAQVVSDQSTKADCQGYNEHRIKTESDSETTSDQGSTSCRNGVARLPDTVKLQHDISIVNVRTAATTNNNRLHKKVSNSERHDLNGTAESKVQTLAEEENGKVARSGGSNNEHSSNGAYMLVYEKRRADPSSLEFRDESQRSQNFDDNGDEPLKSYLQKIIDNEAKEFASMEADAAALRLKASSQARELRLEMKEISCRLAYRPENGRRPRFVETSFLAAWIRKTRELIKKLSQAQTAVHPATSEQPEPVDVATAESGERQSRSRRRSGSVVTSESQKDGLTAQDSDDGGDPANSSVWCPHGRLAPDAIGLRVISDDGAELLWALCSKHHLAETELARQQDIPQEQCRECVVGLARRTLLASRLANDKKAITKLFRVKDQAMYWVSNRSLQSWDKMVERRLACDLGLRSAGEEETTLNTDLICEHGGLSLRSRKQVPRDVWLLLKQYFPDSREFPGNHPDCTLCLKESEDAQTAQAERLDAASSLRSRLDGLMKARKTFQIEKHRGYLLHSEQADAIRKFLRYPRGLRPTGLKNGLLCHHNGTLLDHPTLEPGGLFPDHVIFLLDEEWTLLSEEFGLLGAVEVTCKQTDSQPGELIALSYKPAICQPCLAEARSSAQQAAQTFCNAWITVQMVSLEDLLRNKVASSRDAENAEEGRAQNWEESEISTFGGDRQAVLGRGKRIKGNRLVQINSDDKFVDLKVKLMALFNVVPLLQVVVVNGHVIEADGDVLLKDIGLIPGSLVYVAERYEEGSPQNDEPEPTKKRPKTTEHGFAGTKLVG